MWLMLKHYDRAWAGGSQDQGVLPTYQLENNGGGSQLQCRPQQ